MDDNKTNGSPYGAQASARTFTEFVMELLDCRKPQKREPNAYSARELASLHEVIFVNLRYISADVDGNAFDYFNAADFLKVIARCELLRVEVNGAAVFSRDGKLLEVVDCDEHGLNWARAAVAKWQSRPDVLFCASYGISADLLQVFS